jgi:hypothetical protein
MTVPPHASPPPHAEPAKRVVIRSADVGPRRVGVSSRAFDEHSEYRDVLLHSLIRAQFGLTLGFIALTVGALISLPLVVSLMPWLAGKHLLGLPFSLAVLGVAVYPVLLIIGLAYTRLAERTERHFLDLVDKL